jgi:hypothetical protein
MVRQTLFSVAAIAALAAAGCGDNVGPDADLAGADDAHLSRALAAATGGDARAALALADTLAAGDPSSCPSVETAGDTTTITGGCGGMLGRIVVEARAEGRTSMARTTFEQFGDGVTTIDGVVERAPDGTRLEADLTTTENAIAARATLSLECDERAVCGVDSVSYVQVDGLGFADVLGAWRHDPLGGSLTLVGAGVATFDFNAVVDGCIPFTIDGSSGHRLCE